MSTHVRSSMYTTSTWKALIVHLSAQGFHQVPDKPLKTYAAALDESIPPTPDESREITLADYRGYRKLCDIVIETYNTECKLIQSFRLIMFRLLLMSVCPSVRNRTPLTIGEIWLIIGSNFLEILHPVLFPSTLLKLYHVKSDLNYWWNQN